MEKQVFVDFASRIISLEKDKKEIATEIKDSIAAFAENNGLDAESVKDSIGAYKKYLKDSEKFCLVDAEVSQILNDVVYKELGYEKE